MKGITEEMVAEAAEALIGKGKKPTQDNVRMELGNTGSKTTISKYLSQWKDKKLLANSEREQDKLIQQPDTINQAVNLVWENLNKEAEEKINKIKNDYENKIIELLGVKDSLQEKLNLSENELKQANINNQNLQDEKVQMQDRINKLSLELQEKIIMSDKLMAINEAIEKERHLNIIDATKDLERRISELQEELQTAYIEYNKQEQLLISKLEDQRVDMMMKIEKLKDNKHQLELKNSQLDKINANYKEQLELLKQHKNQEDILVSNISTLEKNLKNMIANLQDNFKKIKFKYYKPRLKKKFIYKTTNKNQI